jgi:hypothetical protein
MKRSRLHLYAVFIAFSTLLVVMSGAALTSSRGLFQNVHMAAGVADAFLIAGLSIWRRRGWSILAIVMVDAGLGKFQGPVAGILHACLAALLFAGVAAISLFTSRSWQGDSELVQDYGRPSLRFLSGAAALLVALQIAFGAGFRHNAVGVLPHLLGAMVAALFIMIVGVFVTTQFPKHRSLRPMAVAFMTITGIQVFLGMAAFLMRLMNMAGTRVFLAISVAHVATGSLVLAVSVMLALEIRRSVLPRARETP